MNGGARSIVAWRFVDGRAGHENQTLGLVRALAERLPTETHDVRPRHAGARAALDWLLGRTPDGGDLPDPDLLLAAGHGTHLPMLAAARARGGRRVVLMRPSLPLALFDLCLAPAHDGLAGGARVINTRGAINALRHSSAHDEVVRQVTALVEAAPALRWTVGGSPRTPPSTLAALRVSLPDGADIVPFADTTPDWLPARLAGAGSVWVTQDSVSMVYESLTAGAATGLIELPLARGSRVQRGVAELVGDGLVTTWSAWRDGALPSPPRERLDEAGRCADWMVEHWFSAA